jgi:8-oxo-dGTP diphosphatase
MKRIHVVAAVIEHDGRVLIARRPEHVHQGGKWEFPGGKVEPVESPLEALGRELREELGIEVSAAQPLITIAHNYPDKHVLLDVWRVSAFEGKPYGVEGQEVRWVPHSELSAYEFPAANAAIVTAAQLPSSYVITPEIGESVAVFLAQLRQVLEQGYRLIQLRVKHADAEQQRLLQEGVLALIGEFDVVVLINSALAEMDATRFDGVHLTASDLLALTARPTGIKWLAASCHSLHELQKAVALGVDFVTLSPLYPTASHPNAKSLGDEQFVVLMQMATVPVYALGGVREDQLPHCLALGAQGVAGISSFWPNQ